MPRRGWKHSREARARIAAANVGRRHTTETRQKISAGLLSGGKHLGKVISPAHRAAVSAAHRGREFSSQHRQRISAALIAYMSACRPRGRQRSWPAAKLAACTSASAEPAGHAQLEK
jgi:NUMOD3 motif